MNPNKALWEKGDFSEIAAFMRQSGEAVEALHNQLLELAKAQNKSTDGSTSIPATFLRVTVSLWVSCLASCERSEPN